MRRCFSLVLVAFVLLVVMVGVASADQPSQVSYSLSGPLDSVSLDQAAPAFGDSVTFTYSPDPAPGGWISLKCYQNDVLVLSTTHAAYSDGTAYGYHLPFLLGPTYKWTGGSAECHAHLVYAKRGSIYRVKPAASVTFTASG